VSEAGLTAADLIALFETAAEEAYAAESAYRQEAAARIQDLVTERANAFRRLNLVRVIAATLAAHAGDEGDGAVAAARSAVRNELGWPQDSAPHEDVLDHLTPVFRSLLPAQGDGEVDEEDAEETVDAAVAHLRAFEAWYRDSKGSDFYALFDRYIPETPVVDF